MAVTEGLVVIDVSLDRGLVVVVGQRLEVDFVVSVGRAC